MAAAQVVEADETATSDDCRCEDSARAPQEFDKDYVEQTCQWMQTGHMARMYVPLVGAVYYTILT